MFDDDSGSLCKIWTEVDFLGILTFTTGRVPTQERDDLFAHLSLLNKEDDCRVTTNSFSVQNYQ